MVKGSKGSTCLGDILRGKSAAAQQNLKADMDNYVFNDMKQKVDEILVRVSDKGYNSCETSYTLSIEKIKKLSPNMFAQRPTGEIIDEFIESTNKLVSHYNEEKMKCSYLKHKDRLRLDDGMEFYDVYLTFEWD